MQAEQTRETDPLLPQEHGGDHDEIVEEESRLHRSLSARQVQTIALGGAIGTGLFLGTGRILLYLKYGV